MSIFGAVKHCVLYIGRNFKPIRIHASYLRSCTANMSKRKSDNLPLANELSRKRTASDVSFAQPITEEDTFPSTQESYVCGDESLLSVEDVAKQLEDIGLPEAAEKFRDEKISGSALDMMTEEQLRKMGIEKTGDRLKILKSIRGISEKYLRKVFNDPVHGHIEIHPLVVKFIDTPQFQRLRYLKQLGASYFVYPGAAHNRFEHCIGVCHLAGELVRTLQKRQPELDITNKDVLCVEIAGLCHDLGHGPFSHLFDGKFIPLVRPGFEYKHEVASVKMFQHMIDENNLKKYFPKYGLTEQDIEFIKEQIKGPKNCGKGRRYDGREKSKEFLYEIVANQRNGIDVDKWDYLARDCHGLGIKNSFDHQRFMKFARVLEVDGSLQICSRDKEAYTIYSMFSIRATLHKIACQHRVCNAIDIMIIDAFKHAENTELIPGKDGKRFRMSKCIDDPEAFTNLNDSIFHVLLMSTDKDLEVSRNILQRIQRRQLYRCVGETKPTKAKNGKTEDDVKIIKEEIMSHLPKESSDMLSSHDLVVYFVNFDYGANTENPIKNVRFYNKKDVTKAVALPEDQLSLMLPTVFAEQLIRLYCRRTDEKSIELATYCFQKWCDDKDRLKQDSLTPDKGTDKYDEKTPDNKP